MLGLIVAGLILTLRSSQDKEDGPQPIRVTRGDLIQEVSETGRVEAAQELTLGFERAGRLETIYVKEGEAVERGQALAVLEREELTIQLAEAEAARETARAKLDQLLAGASPEEIKVAETAVANAQTSLANEQQNLTDVEAEAANDLAATYQDALNALAELYLTSYNVWQDVEAIKLAYFSGTDQDSITIQEEEEKIEQRVVQENSSLVAAQKEERHEDIDEALSVFKDSFSTISSALTKVKEVTDRVIYDNTISSAHKNNLETGRDDIASGFSSIVDYQQVIASTKVTNATNINTAQAKVNKAQGELEKARDQLELKKASPRQVEIDLYQAQLREAASRVNLFTTQLEKAVLKSPFEGVVTEVAKERGEMVQAGEDVITLISSKPFQLKVDIYEEDIGKIKRGDPVAITLVAFPERPLAGKVVAVDPAEKLIEDVVYYEVTIDFEALLEEIKPGMTADIIIKTASRKDVLILPKSFLIKKEGKTFVRVLKGGQLKEREIEVGLEGRENRVEILAGLEEGEEVVLPP